MKNDTPAGVIFYIIKKLKSKRPKAENRWSFQIGGGKRDRTADLLHAMQALSQLSYTPNIIENVNKT